MYDNEIFRFGRNPVGTKTKKPIINTSILKHNLTHNMMNNPQLNKSTHRFSFNSRRIPVKFRFKTAVAVKTP